MNGFAADPPLTEALLRKRAAAHGIELPPTPAPRGAYLPGVAHRDVAYGSGAGPVLHGTRLHCGYVGGDVTLEQAQEAAAVAAVNALVNVISCTGGVDGVERLLKLTGFVRSAPGFTAQNVVVDGASQILHALLGERGAHARSAVGVAELPFGICVEIEISAAVRPATHGSRATVRQGPTIVTGRSTSQ